MHSLKSRARQSRLWVVFRCVESHNRIFRLWLNAVSIVRGAIHSIGWLVVHNIVDAVECTGDRIAGPFPFYPARVD